jgi:hypothetical protein
MEAASQAGGSLKTLILSGLTAVTMKLPGKRGQQNDRKSRACLFAYPALRKAGSYPGLPAGVFYFTSFRLLFPC